jgi:hypothetical protein
VRKSLPCGEQKTQNPARMKHWQTTFAILAALSASILTAEDFKTINGKEYNNATVSRVEPNGIVLRTKSGILKVYFTELPKEVQQRFNYDPEKAAAYSANQSAALQQTRKQQEQATPTATPLEVEIRDGEGFDAEIARIRAYYEPRIRAAAQAGDTKVANQLGELEKKEFYQAVGRHVSRK